MEDTLSSKTVNLVIIFLGLMGLATIVGGFVLAYQGTDIPAALIGLGSGAIGAVAGILAKGPSQLAGPPPPVDLAGLRSRLTALVDEVDKATPKPQIPAPS